MAKSFSTTISFFIILLNIDCSYDNIVAAINDHISMINEYFYI